MRNFALGLIETRGLVGAIEATDAAAKAASVVIATAELTPAAYMTLKIEGELSAVQAAVNAGARAAERVGELVAAHVIPRPDEELGEMLPPRRYISKYHPDDRPSLEYESSRPETALSRAPDRKPQAKTRERPHRAPTRERTEMPPPAPQPPVVRPVPPPPPAMPSAPATVPSDISVRPSLSDLEKLPVVKLRRFARTVENLPIKGRQISMANKQQLLEAIKTAWNVK